MKIASIHCIKRARIARLSRVKRCSANDFHKAMALPDVSITITRSNNVLVKRGDLVIAAAMAEHYFIDSAA